MSSNLIPKPFNYYATTVTTTYTLGANTYNVIYANGSAPFNINLPVLSTMLDGFPLYVINIGTATATVLLSGGGTLAAVPAGETFFTIVNKETTTWQVALGPTATAGIVSGPGSSTNNAIALWNGTTGTVLQNSTVTIVAGAMFGATIVDSTNNVAANSLKTTGAVVNVSSSAPPTTGQTLIATSATTATWQTPVSGPGSSTSTAIALWSGTSGTVLQNSVVLVGSGGAITGVASVTLATTSGTATPLSYYEETTLAGNTFTGAFSVAQACVIQMTRIGRMVTLLFPSVQGTSLAAVATSSVNLPTRYLPNAQVGVYTVTKWPIIVQNSSATPTGGQAAGELDINNSTGAITIGVASATGAAAFTVTQSSGWAEFSICYSI